MIINSYDLNRIAVTGASGFVGHALCHKLHSSGYEVLPIIRSRSTSFKNALIVENIGPDTDWFEVLSGVDCVIHCAAKVHVVYKPDSDSSIEFREVNFLGTRNLAEQAASYGVRRLIFLSSVKVNGEQTTPGVPFYFNDPVEPNGAYALSKWEAEQALWQVAEKSGLEIVVVRPPLVYGPGVKANFKKLMRLVLSGIPLPFGRVDNRRSLVYIENLLDLIVCCINNPIASGQTFMVSDGHDVSLAELVHSLSVASGRSAHLLPVPGWLLQMFGRVCGRLHDVERLLGSLQVDINHTCNTLKWKPPVSFNEGLRKTVRIAESIRSDY